MRDIRTRNIGKVCLLILVLIFTIPFATDELADANFSMAALGESSLIKGLEVFSLVADEDLDFLHPELAAAKSNNAPVHLVSVEKLVKLYSFFTKQLPPDEVLLYYLTSVFKGWTPVYLPPSDYDLEDQILISAGIIDMELITQLQDAILNAGYRPEKMKTKGGYVAFVKGIIPQHYPSDRIVINWPEGKIVQWPVMVLESELNIPAYRWRVWHIVKGERHLLADWPVIVGKTSTRTRVAFLPMDQLERYPPWTDPETKKYVEPGPRNPLGVWKLKSTYTRRLWYYHGTNKPHLLKRTYRAFSHGCIRNDNDNIRRLSWLLLTHNAGTEVKTGMVTGRTDIFQIKRWRKIKLIRPVMARNVYDTIEVKAAKLAPESIVTIYPNVYSIKLQTDFYRPTTVKHLKQELTKLGIQAEQLDSYKLRSMVWASKHLRRPKNLSAKTFLQTTEANHKKNAKTKESG